MLSDRRQRVLRALVEEYIANAQPVGSRTLVDRYSLGVSPATVRNELSVLEDEGYITSPHTSAGRIPTDIGYRAFVDRLLESEYGDDNASDQFDQLREEAVRLDDLISETSVQLARLTDCLSVVMAPGYLSSSVKQVSLAWFAPRKAMLVVITTEGQVLNRMLDFAFDVNPEDLLEVQNSINMLLPGKSAAQIKDIKSTSTLVEALDAPLGKIVIDELFACLSTAEGALTRKLGLSSLLSKPEFSNSAAALPILQVLEDDVILMSMFDDLMDNGESLEIRIGSENSQSQLSGVSVVAAQYGPAQAHGIVAVIGPTRMDYSTVIKAVRAARSALDE